MNLTARQEQVKADFIRIRGTWSDLWDTVLRLDAEFLAAYAEYSGLPWQSGVLPPKVKELVYIIADASATHLYVPGIRQHIAAARSHGATTAEIVATLELATLLGYQSVDLGRRVLDEALGARMDTADGVPGPGPLMSRLAAAQRSLASVPLESPALDAKTRALLLIGLYAAPTTLLEQPLRLQIDAALDAGGSIEEIEEVLAIVSVLGVHALTTAAPLLAEVIGTSE